MSDCIESNGRRSVYGYGVLRVGKRQVKAHRWAWTLAYGDPGEMCVLHKCDNRSCINVEHLFLGTRRDNNEDRTAKGRSFRPQGELHNMAKLTAAEVLEIRAASGTLRSIGTRYGVSDGQVSRIRSRKTWAHL